jgi:hypothetical protein
VLKEFLSVFPLLLKCYSLSLRLGFGYARGFRRHALESIVVARQVRRFRSVKDLAHVSRFSVGKSWLLLARIDAMHRTLQL